MENQPPRQMFDVNEVCSSCEAAIKQLPFQPDPSRKSQLRCIDCWKKSRDEQKGTQNNF